MFEARDLLKKKQIKPSQSRKKEKFLKKNYPWLSNCVKIIYAQRNIWKLWNWSIKEKIQGCPFSLSWESFFIEVLRADFCRTVVFLSFRTEIVSFVTCCFWNRTKIIWNNKKNEKHWITVFVFLLVTLNAKI